MKIFMISPHGVAHESTTAVGVVIIPHVAWVGEMIITFRYTLKFISFRHGLVIQRRHAAQPPNHLDRRVRAGLSILHRVLPAQGQPQGTMGDLMGQPMASSTWEGSREPRCTPSRWRPQSPPMLSSRLSPSMLGEADVQVAGQALGAVAVEA